MTGTNDCIPDAGLVGDVGIGRCRVQQDHLGFLADRLHGDRGGTGDVTQDDLDLVLRDHAPRRGHRLNRGSLAVTAQQFDRGAVHAPRGVDLLHGEFGAVRGETAPAGRRAAQGHDQADPQWRFPGILRACGSRQCRCGGGEGGELAACQHGHGDHSFDAGSRQEHPSEPAPSSDATVWAMRIKHKDGCDLLL